MGPSWLSSSVTARHSHQAVGSGSHGVTRRARWEGGPLPQRPLDGALARAEASLSRMGMVGGLGPRRPHGAPGSSW